jgi:predicted dehydrogenase
MVRFGILGFGHHAVLRLVPGFAGSEHCSLNGLWRRNPEKARENALAFNIPHNYPTPAELCASPEIDAIFVTSPDAFHKEHVLLSIEHGKPVLCEKPLGMNAAEVEAMVAASRQAGVPFGVAQNFRFNASVSLAQQWIAEGRIGKPRLAHVQFCYQGESSPREWIYDPALACGGPIGDVGIHCIDAMRYLLRDEVAAVSTLARKDALSGDVESSAVIALELVSGAFGMVSVTTRAEYRSLFEVVGERGTILCEDGLTVSHPVDVVLRREGRVVASETVSNADGYSRMLDSFATALAGEAEYLATGEDGLVNQQVLDAAYASWRSGARQILTSH